MRPGNRMTRAALTVLIAVLVATAAAQYPGAREHSVPSLAMTTQPQTPSPRPAVDERSPALRAGTPVSYARSWGPSSKHWLQAQADVESLTVEQAAAQVIVPHWSSPDIDGLAAMMVRGGFGGVILMGGAITSADALVELTEEVQRAGGDRPWGTLVSTDQEGGTVARLRGIVSDLPGFMAAGAARDKSAVTRAYRELAIDMRDLGVTVDFAPVADMTIGLADPTIRTRSAGDTSANVSATVVAAAQGFIAGGVVPVVKHFPGHGSVTVDSHTAVPHQSASLAQLEERDLVPFAHAIDAGVPAVMMGHVALAEWGDVPASLSPAAYAYLRDEMGFDGVAVTDALDMGAITRDHSSGEAAVAALAAGADVLLMPADPIAARDAVVAAVESGTVSRSRLDEAATRMIALQRWQLSLGAVVDLETNYGRDLAVAGATVAAVSCDAPFVTGQVEIVGGSQSDRNRLARALVARGVEAVLGGSDTPPKSGDITTVAFTGGGASLDGADVVVATGVPWALEGVSAPTLVALYGNSADALAGLADVLTGLKAPGGQWPVSMDVPHDTCG